MTIRALYRLPVETARHEQIKIFIEQYFINTQKLMDHPSRLYAEKARKALINIRKVAHQRGLELLELYAPSRNIGRQPITIPQKQNQPRKKIHNVS